MRPATSHSLSGIFFVNSPSLFPRSRSLPSSPNVHLKSKPRFTATNNQYNNNNKHVPFTSHSDYSSMKRETCSRRRSFTVTKTGDPTPYSNTYYGNYNGSSDRRHNNDNNNSNSNNDGQGGGNDRDGGSFGGSGGDEFSGSWNGGPWGASPMTIQMILLHGWNSYMMALNAKPMLTQTLTSAVLLPIGELLAQWIQISGKSKGDVQGDRKGNNDAEDLQGPISNNGGINFARLWSMAGLGLILDGPVGTLWYSILPTLFHCSHKWKQIIKMQALTDLVYSPIYLVPYIILDQVLVGNGFQAGIDSLKANFAKSVQSNWKFWPISHFIMYVAVPIQLRVLYVNVLSIGWTAYLSLLLNDTNTTSTN